MKPRIPSCFRLLLPLLLLTACGPELPGEAEPFVEPSGTPQPQVPGSEAPLPQVHQQGGQVVIGPSPTLPGCLPQQGQPQ